MFFFFNKKILLFTHILFYNGIIFNVQLQIIFNISHKNLKNNVFSMFYQTRIHFQNQNLRSQSRTTLIPNQLKIINFRG